MEPPDSTRNQREVEQQDAKYEAIENLKKVLGESVKEHGDKQQDTNFFLAFGLLHMGNQVKTAIEWFGKAFSLAKEQDDKKQEIAASINLANAYKLDNQLQMAKRYDQNVLGIAREQKYRSQLNMAKKLEIEELSKIIGKLIVCHLLKYILYCSNCF
jgi:tetratricopeptide (TPR) repeat protein